MVIRIDTDSFHVEKTARQSVYKITATITTDGVEVTEPELHNVTILWNKNAGVAQMLTDLEAAIPSVDAALETAIANFKAANTEVLITPAAPAEPQDIVITATNVTVNQV